MSPRGVFQFRLPVKPKPHLHTGYLEEKSEGERARRRVEPTNNDGGGETTSAQSIASQTSFGRKFFVFVFSIYNFE